MSEFNEILNQRSKDVKKLDPLPVGLYQATVAGLPALERVGKNNTPAAKFTWTGFIPLEVDRGELAKCGDISKREIIHTQFLTQPSAPRLKKLFDDLGIPEGELTLGQRMDQVTNRQCVVRIKHTPSSTDSTTIYAEIAQTSKLP
jgi:hypothetical protein